MFCLDAEDDLVFRRKGLAFYTSFSLRSIEHCTAEDILDVAQLLNRLCIQCKGNAVPAMDAALLPFLRKYRSLVATIQNEGRGLSDIRDPAVQHPETEYLAESSITFR
jgi:hypothetical protein